VIKVPDEKTVWAFREELTKKGIVELLFAQFLQFMEEKNLIFSEGKLIDASFTIAPRQRNTQEENEKIKREKVMVCGKTNLPKNSTKILMHVGQRKMERGIMVIRTM